MTPRSLNLDKYCYVFSLFYLVLAIEMNCGYVIFKSKWPQNLTGYCLSWKNDFDEKKSVVATCTRASVHMHFLQELVMESVHLA